MPRVGARYIDREPLLAGCRADFIPRAVALIQCWKTPPNGHNSGTVPRQGAHRSGNRHHAEFHEARHCMASVVQAPMIQAPAVPAAALATGRDLRLDLCRGLAL